MTSSVFDYATPYDVMVGYWAGIANSYDAKGEYVGSVPSRVAVYWEKPHSLLHFRTDQVNMREEMLEGGSALRAAVADFVGLEFDLTVTGKYATGGSVETAVTGTETRPDVYHFHLENKSKGTDWYNNHYFTSPNERHIMGPGLLHRKIEVVVSQIFTRISYNVPKTYKRELPR